MYPPGFWNPEGVAQIRSAKPAASAILKKRAAIFVRNQ
jgi:hypothetical protein